MDYERAILKFREKTTALNEEVQNLRDELATMRAREEEKARAAGAEISLLANANRTFAEVISRIFDSQINEFFTSTQIVEAELRAIELDSAKQHVNYLRSFLPDNFTKAGGLFF